MSVKAKLIVTCDEPGCEETFSCLSPLGPPLGSLTAIEQAAPPGWQLPRPGDVLFVATFCPRHRRPS